ncbi:hypothetical protein RBI94_02080 [Pseudomonas putida]|uniref:hypothetical protein n=1 Tax=Pseudomonas putida TaxID=303 RepID=UPI001F0AA827|nr:hypothetical protein [Pseudomonas putida]MDQ2482809.1 hypothetical protein [Pseudomonas putida]
MWTGYQRAQRALHDVAWLARDWQDGALGRSRENCRKSGLAGLQGRVAGRGIFLQEWASTAWNCAEGPEISLDDVVQSYSETLALLDAGFFRVRIDQLTPSEVIFVRAMSELGDGPYAVGDIAKAMGRTQSSLGPIRAKVIAKGMAYSTDHGVLDFTVPLFAEFMRRQS